MSVNSTCDMIGMFASWIEPYSATYSFCGDAARRCGGSNTTSKMVFDSSLGVNAERELFFFYTEQMHNSTVLDCFTENAPNATIAWAASANQTRAKEVTISSGWEFPSAGTAKYRRPSKRLSVTASLLVTVMLLLLGSGAGVGAASTPYRQERRSVGEACENGSSLSCTLSPAKRQAPKKILCHQFVPNGPPTLNFTRPKSTRLSFDCEDSPNPCWNNGTGFSDLRISGEYYELLVDGPGVLFAGDAMDGLFNATQERQYSGTLKTISYFITLSVPGGESAGIQASRPADQYDGELRRCDDGKTYAARYTGPRDDVQYTLDYR